MASKGPPEERNRERGMFLSSSLTRSIVSMRPRLSKITTRLRVKKSGRSSCVDNPVVKSPAVLTTGNLVDFDDNSFVEL